jgi:hypothetical protein
MNDMRAMTVAEQALGMALPTRRDEDWKWTDLRRLVDKNVSTAIAVTDAAVLKRLLAKAPLAHLTSGFEWQTQGAQLPHCIFRKH